MNDTNKERAELIDLIAHHLHGTYHCTRVWHAWGIGTMSQDDFEDVCRSDTPAELADAILASRAAKAPAAPTGWYALAADGMATLCVDRDDAEKTAADSEKEWPNCGPFRAVQLYCIERDARAAMADKGGAAS